MKRKITHFIIIFFTLGMLSSCDVINNLAGTDLSGLTTEDVVAGLKKALVIGTDSSSTELSVQNGYYGNEFVKIPLPDEAETVRQQIVALSNISGLSNVFNLDQQFENVVKSLNRAAEEAAVEARPIFADAITGITIDQGWDILNGINPLQTTKSGGFDSTAATGYFKLTTHDDLKALFAPKINLQLDKDLGLGFSANQAWTALRNGVNNSLNTIQGNTILNILYQNSGYTVNRIQETSIGDFATEKALDGLFLKVGEQEKKIRNNPYAWADQIIQQVFGSVTN
jgi:hypothetical protein